MSFDVTIYETALADGMPRPLALCIVAQSKHETNDYTSDIFLDCNNAFGYRVVTSSCVLNPGYQNYNSVAESTHEITAWIKRRLSEGNFPPLNQVVTVDQYAQILKDNGYYEDTLANYLAGLKRWYVDNIGVSSGLIAVALAIGAYLFFKYRKK